jgi:hypothetical protein
VQHHTKHLMTSIFTLQCRQKRNRWLRARSNVQNNRSAAQRQLQLHFVGKIAEYSDPYASPVTPSFNNICLLIVGLPTSLRDLALPAELSTVDAACSAICCANLNPYAT